MAYTGSNRRVNFIAITCAIVAVFLILFSQSSSFPQLSQPSIDTHHSYKDSIPTSLETTSSKYAYVTLLAPDRSVDSPKDYHDDVYFSALRLLSFQLLHSRETRSEGIPFIVMTVPGVPEGHKHRLRRDGVIVREIEHITLPEWMSHAEAPNFARFADMFDKLRAWELTQFDKVLFVDLDVVPRKPLHPLFEEIPVQQPHSTDEDPVPPADYLFAATPEVKFEHHFPPTNEGDDFAVGDGYFNGGFFMMKPSLDVYRYYMERLAIPDSFPTDMMEQNFLNSVHGKDGNMPWTTISPSWHMHWPTKEDFDGGAKSFHEKWWEPQHPEMSPWLKSQKAKMDGYYEAWDLFAPV